MDMRQLKYFLAVAEEGQITKAANKLHITQPPLSQQIQLLEKELGVSLFERSNRNVRLTEAGRILQNRAEQLVELMKTTISELHSVTEGQIGSLSIGAISSAGDSLLPTWIQTYHQRYPNIAFQLWQGETHRILELLNAGVVDLGIVRFPVDQKVYDFITLPSESMIIAAHSSVFQTNKSSVIRLEELKKLPLMMHRRHKSILVEQCSKVGFEPNILCTSDDIMPLLLWANSGIGFAVVPKSAESLLPGSSLVFREIIRPFIKTTSAVIWKKKYPRTAAVMNFLAMIEHN